LNWINVVNEVINLSAFGYVSLMNATELSPTFINVMGWVLVGMIILSLLIAWTTTIPPTFRAFFGSPQSSSTHAKKSEDNEMNKRNLMANGTEVKRGNKTIVGNKCKIKSEL
jgi:hypothetical protein